MILDSFHLQGKTALVTGSSRGLGAAIAVAMAEAGANVALHGSKSVPEEVVARIAKTGAKTGAKHTELTADLRHAEAAPALVEQTVREFGAIDILVNNAGMIRRAPALDTPLSDWLSIVQTNLTSAFQLSQAAGRHMLAQGSGKIINIASVLSFQGGILVPAYAAAKGGLAQLTKALANEWAARGINVNAIAPGYMATDNTEALRKDPVRSRQVMERIPAAPWGRPEDVAGAALFLASAAGNYVHGHILVVDGGWMGR